MGTEIGSPCNSLVLSDCSLATRYYIGKLTAKRCMIQIFKRHCCQKSSQLKAVITMFQKKACSKTPCQLLRSFYNSWSNGFGSHCTIISNISVVSSVMINGERGLSITTAKQVSFLLLLNNLSKGWGFVYLLTFS